MAIERKDSKNSRGCRHGLLEACRRKSKFENFTNDTIRVKLDLEHSIIEVFKHKWYSNSRQWAKIGSPNKLN